MDIAQIPVAHAHTQGNSEGVTWPSVTSGSPVGHVQWHILYYYSIKIKAREKAGHASSGHVTSGSSTTNVVWAVPIYYSCLSEIKFLDNYLMICRIVPKHIYSFGIKQLKSHLQRIQRIDRKWRHGKSSEVTSVRWPEEAMTGCDRKYVLPMHNRFRAFFLTKVVVQ